MRNPLRSSFPLRPARPYAALTVIAFLAFCLASLSRSGASVLTAESGTSAALVSGDASRGVKKYGRRGDHQRCAPPGDHEIYIPLTDLPEARGGELVFNSRSPREMEVTPTFYTLDGEAVVGDPVLIGSAEIRYVDIRRLIPAGHRARRDWGGLSLSYHGVPREMWAQFRLLGVNGGGNVDEFFTVKAEQRSDVQEAVWWAPRGSTSIIALGNITDAPTSAIVTFGGGDIQTVDLAPHAAQIIRREGGDEAGAGSVVINIKGAPGSVIPAGLITSKEESFNSVIRFYDTKGARQPHLFGNGLRLAGVSPHMVLKNTTPSPVSARPKFTALGGPGSAEPLVLPEVSLGPQEVKEIDLTPLSTVVKGGQAFDVASVQVAGSGGPGSLIGALYSIHDRTGVSYDTPLRDSGQLRTMTGSYPWKIVGDYTTLVYVTNISDQEAGFAGEINYGGGRFIYDPRTLRPGETAVFDLRKIRDEQSKDNAGRRLPKEVSLGQFKWAVRGATNGKLLLIGRAEMVSRSQRISTSYSCNDPCPPTYDGWLDPFPPPVVYVNNTGDSAAWEQMTYDWGYSVGPYAVSASWSLSSAVGTLAPGYGHSTLMTGTTPGTATFDGFIGVYQDYVWDGLNCYELGTYEGGSEGPVEVTCPTPTGETTSSGGWADSDFLPTVHKWNVTLTPSNISFAGRGVQEQTPSPGSDTCWFQGSQFDPNTSLTGSTWTVQFTNFFGPDYIGWVEDAVPYYRFVGRAPCAATLPQQMLIDCPSGGLTPYANNTVVAGIQSATVTSTRAGQSAIRFW